jgi:hypothetical protein
MIASCTVSVYGLDAPSLSQDSKEKAAPQPSDAERQAAMKIATAADVPAALTAAGEFIKKYPKSSLRGEITRRIVAKIAENQDVAQKATMLENTLTVFKEAGDAEIIGPILLDTYLKSEKYDDAFRVAAILIEKNPNDVITTTQLAIVGFEQVKRQNTKFLPQSTQYGNKAIELIEADKKPSTLDDTQWTEYKTKWLAQLYQSLGIISAMSRNSADAKMKLEKAAAINPGDPVTYMMMGSLIQDEYQQLAQQVKNMSAGPAQDEVLKKTHEKMDQIIGYFAQAIGLAYGNPQYQKLHDELLVDLRTFYSYRHNGSTEGLQQLIDKYKKPQQ